MGITRLLIFVLGVYLLFWSIALITAPEEKKDVPPPDFSWVDKRIDEAVGKYVYATEMGDTVIVTCILHNELPSYKNFDEISKKYLDAYYVKIGEYLAQGYEFVPQAIGAAGINGCDYKKGIVFITVLKKPAKK